MQVICRPFFTLLFTPPPPHTHTHKKKGKKAPTNQVKLVGVRGISLGDKDDLLLGLRVGQTEEGLVGGHHRARRDIEQLELHDELLVVVSAQHVGRLLGVRQSEKGTFIKGCLLVFFQLCMWVEILRTEFSPACYRSVLL